jgi:WD40 repeat protein
LTSPRWSKLSDLEREFTQETAHPDSDHSDAPQILLESRSSEPATQRHPNENQGADITLVQTLGGHSGHCDYVAFSPDGKRLASTASNGVQLWSAESGNLVQWLKDSSSTVKFMAFSPDGKRLASVFYYAAWLWSAESRMLVKQLKSSSFMVICMAFSLGQL